MAGTWEGTSLCQIKPSPCHDEHVIYRIKTTGQRSYSIDAYKVVGGQEQYMGPLDMLLDRPATNLPARTRDRSGVVHPWLFTSKAHI